MATGHIIFIGTLLLTLHQKLLCMSGGNLYGIGLDAKFFEQLQRRVEDNHISVCRVNKGSESGAAASSSETRLQETCWRLELDRPLCPSTIPAQDHFYSGSSCIHVSP